MTRQLACSPAVHSAIKLDDVAWSQLQYIGIQRDEEEPAEDLELRNCSVCHSTLCRQVRP
jgi:hypothetical protein